LSGKFESKNTVIRGLLNISKLVSNWNFNNSKIIENYKYFQVKLKNRIFVVKAKYYFRLGVRADRHEFYLEKTKKAFVNIILKRN